MKERDEDLVRICNEIYNKHRTALRLIYENVNINNSADDEIICKTLQKLANENLIIYSEENRWSFFTKAMDDYLPPLKEPKSSWGTKNIYWYWFETDSEHLIMHLELGVWNITNEVRDRMNALMAASNKSTDARQYRRIYLKKEKLSANNYEESLRKAVENLVDAALKNEKTLLEKVSTISNK